MLTSLQKVQFESVSIFLNFVHPFLILFLQCYLYNFYSSSGQLFLCFTQFGCGSHYLNFDKFCDTAPLSHLDNLL